MRPKYTRSRWNTVPVVRPVVNTDGEVLRKTEVRPQVFMASVTTLQFRSPARVEAGKLVGPQDMSRPRPAYYHESGDKAVCICRVAGSRRCEVAGHAKLTGARAVPPPAEWPYDGAWDDSVGLNPNKGQPVAVHSSGARLVRKR